MKHKLFYLLVFMIPLFHFPIWGQGKKSYTLQDKKPSDNVYMTWNKNTPEQEMKDDIKALAEHGVTISYSNVKRNDKGEITGIHVEFSDSEGNKGTMECDNKKPINTIKFFKQDDEVGFGEPAGSEFMMGNAFGGNDMLKQFNLNDENGGLFGQSNSKIIIQKDGKKPLVLENGNVIEGGEDYTAEELEAIKKDNKTESFDGEGLHGFNFDQNELAEQMEKMQEQLDQLMAKQPREPQAPAAKPKKAQPADSNDKEALEQARKEMEAAKKEMEDAKKELEKARSSIKMQKA